MKALALALSAFIVVALAAPTASLAASPTFGTPSVTADLGQPITFSSTIDGDDIAAVDVVVHLQGNPTSIILAADAQINDTYEAQDNINIGDSAICACLSEGQSQPNTKFDFAFRVHASDGSISTGPVAQGVVEDARFQWQTLSSGQVNVHWYAGDQSFGQAAADVANDGINKASQLLGVTLDQPADVFVYDTEDAMRSAVSPDRENVAGEAFPHLDTLYVLIPHDQQADAFAGTLIRHELTHLVLHRATDNPYHDVPHWLDEGVAVYLSEGYTDYWKSFVDPAVANKTLIPLQGLTSEFPSVQSEFYLAYGEAVAAVDYFIRTYGDDKFWSLVKSYANGVSDDDAFTAATGADFEAFNKAWFESLGLEPQNPVGPQPGAAGPLPSDWTGGAGAAPATIGPPVTPGPAASGIAARETAQPRDTAGPDTGSPSGSNGSSSQGDFSATVLLVTFFIVLILGTLLVGLYLRNRKMGPPGPG